MARLTIRMVGDAAEGIENRRPMATDRVRQPTDIEVVKRPPPARAAAPSAPFVQSSLPISPPTAVLTLPEPIQRRLVTVEVRDAASNELVYSDRTDFANQQAHARSTSLPQQAPALLTAGKNLLEIDLIRRGTRPLPSLGCRRNLRRRPDSQRQSQPGGIWALNLPDPLPVLPTPLLPPDPDVALDLGSALRTVRRSRP
ncbi:MAG: DUF4058 family protein [Anaerolineae bacterium]|nr:DUF4058 family protein [Anaerolineae bacterium]